MLSVSAGAFLASLVLKEQVLSDPTCPYTWLPPPCFLSLRGLPRGGAGEKGLGRGPPRITLAPPSLHLAEASAHPKDRDGG